MAVLIFTALPDDLLDAITISLAWAHRCMLAIVVLLGYTGQLSFEQIAHGRLRRDGRGPAGRRPGTSRSSSRVRGGLLAAVPIGVIFALPALRTRGVNLAIVTLGLGSAIFFMVFSNSTLIGGN